MHHFVEICKSLGSEASALAQLGVLLTGCWMALTGSGITGGTLVIFLNLMGSVVTFVSIFPDYIAGRKSASALMERLAERLAKDMQDEGKAVPEDFHGNITIHHLCGELLRLIEVGASCFNHYCTGCDFSQRNVLHNVHRRIRSGYSIPTFCLCF